MRGTLSALATTCPRASEVKGEIVLVVAGRGRTGAPTRAADATDDLAATSFARLVAPRA